MQPAATSPSSTLPCARLLVDLVQARENAGVQLPSADRVEACRDGLIEHGIAALAWSLLRDRPLRSELRAATRDKLSAIAYSLIARESAARGVFPEVLAALDGAGIRVLVFKGEALAQSVYSEPGTRERGDIDLWVPEIDFVAACSVLEAGGWSADPSTHGQWIQPERTFRKSDRVGYPALDLHRRLFGQALLCATLGFEEVFERGLPFDAGPARMPAGQDALLIAVLHRIAHHTSERERLIWLYDIHLICTQMPAALIEASATADARGVAGLLAEALGTTTEYLATPVDKSMLDALHAAGRHQRATRLLRPMSSIGRWWFDFLSVPGFSEKWRFCAELLLPRPAYMRWRYPRHSNWMLPWLYLRRALGGLFKAVTRND